MDRRTSSHVLMPIQASHEGDTCLRPLRIDNHAHSAGRGYRYPSSLCFTWCKPVSSASEVDAGVTVSFAGHMRLAPVRRLYMFHTHQTVLNRKTWGVPVTARSQNLRDKVIWG